MENKYSIVIKVSRKIIAAFVLFALLFTSAQAATYYVDGTAPNDNGSGSAGDPKETINAGLDLMSAGDELVIATGNYLEDIVLDSSSPNGSPGNYTIIRAEDPDAGGVNITGALRFSGAEYFQIEGLKVSYPGGSSATASGISASNHIKIMKSGFEGGKDEGNVVTFGMGSASSFILIEDCWFYGKGGRINLSVYETSDVVLRRVVLRHDHGWSNVGKTEPEGVGTIYNSQRVEVQNLIVLDSFENTSNAGSLWGGAFTFANNASGGASNGDNIMRGSIIYNVAGNAFGFGGLGDILGINFEDVVAWNDWNEATDDEILRPGGVIVLNNNSVKTAYGNRLTLGGYRFGTAIFNGTNNIIDVKNSIVTDMHLWGMGVPDNSGVGVITSEYNNCFNNAGSSNCDSTGLVTTDPQTTGLSYLPRIEDGAALNTAGEAGGRIGAIITNRIGTSGTLYGEEGYNTTTAEALWPWPLEDRIRFDMRNPSPHIPIDNNPIRGFTADGQSLTNYIWEALGNAVPSDIASIILPIPQNIMVTEN